MQRDNFEIDQARPEDMADIMRLESEGFHEGIREAEEVFRARRDCFPEGFLVLRFAGKALGYLCCERWADPPSAEASSFELGHDPHPRHAASGKVLYLASMTIDPRIRGTGAGSRLFNEGRLRIHREAGGLEHEVLLVNEDWRYARRIYERAGFTPAGEIRGFFASLGGPGRAGIVMEKRL